MFICSFIIYNNFGGTNVLFIVILLVLVLVDYLAGLQEEHNAKVNFNCLSVVSAEFKTVQRRPTEYSIT